MGRKSGQTRSARTEHERGRLTGAMRWALSAVDVVVSLTLIIPAAKYMTIVEP